MIDREPLTDTESKVMEFLRREIHSGRGIPPWPEIAKHMGWSSSNSVSYTLKNLAEKDYIRIRGGQRGIEIVGEPDGLAVPIVGEVAAGPPMPIAEDEIGWFDFTRVFGKEGTVMFRVRGESMIDAHISPGDYVVVRRGVELLDGQTVVVQIDDEITLKVYRLIRSKPWLYARNKDIPPLRLESVDDPRLVGVMIGVVRDVNRVQR